MMALCSTCSLLAGSASCQLTAPTVRASSGRCQVLSTRLLTSPARSQWLSCAALGPRNTLISYSPAITGTGCGLLAAIPHSMTNAPTMAHSVAVVLARLPSSTTAPPSSAMGRFGWLAQLAGKISRSGEAARRGGIETARRIAS